MLGILCATREEVTALRAALHLEDEPENHGPTTVWRGRGAHGGVCLAQSGIGKVNAAGAATLLLSALRATRLIFAGVAGGLAPDLPVGAVLLADRLATHDYGIITAGRFTRTASGVIPVGAAELTALFDLPDETSWPYDRLIARVASGLGHPIRRGGLLTGDYFLNCVATREDLRTRFGADAIDMESGAVQQIADAWGAPLHIIRTLSDLAGAESHVTYGEMAAMAAANSAACVRALLEILDETAA